MDTLPAISNSNLRTTAAPSEKLGPDLRQASINLEAAFLAEMLKSAGVGKSGIDVGGNGKESEFGTFLARAYATEIARTGGIGLSELLFQSLLEKTNAGQR